MAEKNHNERKHLDKDKSISPSDFKFALKNIHRTEINNYQNIKPARLTILTNLHKAAFLVVLDAFLLSCAADLAPISTATYRESIKTPITTVLCVFVVLMTYFTFLTAQPNQQH